MVLARRPQGLWEAAQEHGSVHFFAAFTKREHGKI
jgi:hypothetical protein